MENKSCYEVACQNSIVPPLCTVITAFLILEAFSLDAAKPITGLLSSFISLYWTFHFEAERTLVTPSSQPTHKKESDARYSKESGAVARFT